MPKDPDDFDIKEHKGASRLSPRFLSRVLEQRYMFDAAGVATVTNDQNTHQAGQDGDHATEDTNSASNDSGTGSDNATHSSSDNSTSAILSDADQPVMPNSQRPQVTDNQSAISYMNGLPLSFEKNIGQADSKVLYSAHGQAYQMFLTKEGIYFNLLGQDSSGNSGISGLALKFINGNSTLLSGMQQLEAKNNYMLGSDQSKWVGDIPLFGQVKYSQVYEGIDAVVYGSNQNQIEYDFVVSPYADASQIAVQMEGADSLGVDAEGRLLIHTKAGILYQDKPVVYQYDGSQKQNVDARFVVNGDIVTFELGQYDHSKTLYIDPEFVYGTYFNALGTYNDLQSNLGPLVDRFYGAFKNFGIQSQGGYLYITGQTMRTETSNPVFPITPGSFDTSQNGNFDVFIAKLNPQGNGAADLVWSTFIGSSRNDSASMLALDETGNVYVTGMTYGYGTFENSSAFPTTFDAFQRNHSGAFSGSASDAFIFKLNTSGSALVYSTLLGGRFNDHAFDIAIDTNDKIYITGYTSSSDFPVTAPSADTFHSGSSDLFVSKIDPTLSGNSQLVYSTFWGGDKFDTGYGITVDDNGNAYVAGYTTSPAELTGEGNFITTSGAYKTVREVPSSDPLPPSHGFLLKLNPTGTFVDYSTVFGLDNQPIQFYDVAIAPSGNVYVAGSSFMNGGSGLILNGYDQTPYTESVLSSNAIILGFALNGGGASDLLYGTYYGEGSRTAVDLAIDAMENAYVAGSIRQAGSGIVGYYAKFNNTLSTLLYTSQFGAISGVNTLNDFTVPSSFSLDKDTGLLSIIGTTNVATNTTPNAFSTNFVAPNTNPFLSDIQNRNLNIFVKTFSVGSTAPVIVAPSSLTILEDNTLRFNGNGDFPGSNSIVVSSDSASLTATLTVVPSSGFPDGTLSFTRFTGTPAQLNAALANLTYTPNENFPKGTSPGRSSISILVSDGTNVTTKVIDLTINPVQDSPNLRVDVARPLNEDDTGNPGTLVSDIISSSLGVDPERQPLGIAVISLFDGHGFFEYSTDSGSSWNHFGAVSEKNAFLLLPTDRVRFVPDLNFNRLVAGNRSFDFKAWDQTNGTAHTFVDTTIILKLDSETELFSGSRQQEDVSVAIRRDGSALYVWDYYPDSDRSDSYKTTTDSNGRITSEQMWVDRTSGTFDDEAQIVVFSDQGYAIVWERSNGLIGNDVMMQFYDANHNPVGVAKRVSLNTGDTQVNDLPSVALLPNDHFVVYWTLKNLTTNAVDVRATILDRNGNVVTPEFTINQTTAGDQSISGNVSLSDRYHSTVVTSQNGTILTTWVSNQNVGQGFDVYGRLFNSSGVPISNEFLVNASQEGNQHNSVAAMAPDGRFAIAWESSTGDGSGTAIYARFFHADGSAAGPEFIVNQTTSGDQKHPSIAMDKDGNLYVAWHSPNVAGGSGQDIVMRKFSSASLVRPLSEFIVNPSVAGNQLDAAIALDQSGKFILVAYENDSSGVKKVHSVKLSENAFSNIKRFTANLLPVNDAPEIDVPGPQSTNEGTAITIGGISVSDVDVDETASPNNTVSVTLSALHGVLNVSGTATISGNGSESVTVTGTLTEVNATIANVRYTPDANYNGTDILTVLANDLGHTGGAPLSVTQTIALTVNPLNDGPVVHLPGLQTTNEDTAITIEGISISKEGSSPNDTVLVYLRVDHGDVDFSLSPFRNNVLVSNIPDGVSLEGKLTDVNKVIERVRYTPDANYNGNDLLIVRVQNFNDVFVGIQDKLAIRLNAVNDGPEIAVPGAQSTNEDTVLTIENISISDVDVNETASPNNTVSVTLSVDHGILNVSGAATIAGNGSEFVTVRGTLTDVNATIANVRYTPDANYHGTDTLSVLADDLGHTGGAPLSASKTIEIDVKLVGSVNDAPSISIPGAQNVNDNTSSPITGISFADVDLGDNEAKVTLSVTGGTLTLGTKTGLLFLEGDGTFDPRMIFTGKLADLNKALESLSYRGFLNFHGTDSLTVTIDDQGYTGSGGAKQKTETIDITVNLTNKKPIFLTFPGSMSVNEDTSLPIAGISFTDVDLGDNEGKVTIFVTQGTLTLGTRTGLHFLAGTGSEDASMSFTGKLTDLNLALASLSYKGNPNFAGLDSLTVTIDDQGHTGSGGALTETKTIVIVVRAVNDAPDVIVPAEPQTTSEDMGITLEGISISDVDVNETNPPNSMFLVNFSVFHGTLGPSNAALRSVVVTGTLADVNATIKNLKYTPNPDYNGTDTLTVSVKDLRSAGGIVPAVTKTIALQVDPVNDAPEIDVPGPQSTTEDMEITIGGISVSDVDVNETNSPDNTISVTLSVGHGILNVSGSAGIVGNGTESLVVTGTLTDVNAIIANVGYRPKPNYRGTDTLTVSANDLGHTGGSPIRVSETIEIDVKPVGSVNDAPSISIPGAQNVNDNTSSPITGISFADVDLGDNEAKVTLSVTGGTLTLGTKTGLLFLEGDGTFDPRMVFTGKLADLNEALKSLSYQAFLNFHGLDSLTVTIDDQGNTGSGGAKQKTETIDITVNLTNKKPIFLTFPGSQGVKEDTILPITGISFTDVDLGDNEGKVTLSVTQGTLILGTTTGLAFLGENVGFGPNMTFTGKLADLNEALKSLSYQGNLNFTGSDLLTVTIDDQGHTGLGGALTETKTMVIIVHPVNDAPEIAVPGAQSTNEDTGIIIKDISISSVDFNEVASPNDVVFVDLSVDHGILTISGPAFKTRNNSASVRISGTLTDVNATIANVGYTPNPNYNGTDTLRVVGQTMASVGSGDLLPAIKTIAIDVNPVNDGPEIDVPGPQSTTEDMEITIGGISVSDVDVNETNSPDNTISVTLSVGHGILNVSGSAGIVGNGTESLVVTGTLTDVNATIANVGYSPNPNYHGTDTLTVSADDQGHTGGIVPVVTKTIALTVNPVNDGPEIAVPGAQNVNEDTTLPITGISFTDVDLGTGEAKVALSVNQGTLTLGTTTGLIFLEGDGSNDASMSFTGSLVNLNAALASLSYQGNLNFTGSDLLTVTIDDQGNTGSGGALTNEKTIAINVRTNDPAPIQNLSSLAGLVVTPDVLPLPQTSLRLLDNNAIVKNAIPKFSETEQFIASTNFESNSVLGEVDKNFPQILGNELKPNLSERRMENAAFYNYLDPGSIQTLEAFRDFVERGEFLSNLELNDYTEEETELLSKIAKENKKFDSLLKGIVTSIG